MSSTLKTPKEHRSFAGLPGEAGGVDLSDRRDSQTGVQYGEPGEADVNEQGRFGNLTQNLTAIRNVQER